MTIATAEHQTAAHHGRTAQITEIITADRLAARAARDAGNLDEAWRLLERTHILSQPWVWPHVRSHLDMLRLAVRTRDRQEVLGQIVRVLLAGPGSAVGRYPRGNTGRSNVSATQPMPVPDDLAGLLMTAPRHTMRAIVQDSYGGADTWRAAEIAVPEIGDKEVLVKVAAAGLDRGTWHLMTGLPYLGRLAFGIRKPKNPVPGRDLAGTVVAVGSSVTRFAAGDTVFGIGAGSFSEYAAAREDKLASTPTNLTAVQAAVVPISGLTALHALRDAGRLQQGQTVLIVGASGGVGSYAVQLAKAFGANVTGVCSTAKTDSVLALGASRVIDYTQEDFADGTQRYDLVIDIGGSSPLSRLRRAMAPKGTLVIVGGEEGGKLTGMGRQVRALMLSPFVSQRLTMLVPKENHADLERLAELIEDGAVTPSVDREFPLEQAADAMRQLVAGNVHGKLAITI